MGDLFSNTFNRNATASYTYAWSGPCVTTQYKNNTFNNSSCDVSPDFLATLPSLTPLTATGGINSDINSGLKQNKTYEATARLERELVANVAVTAGYVYHKVTNNYVTGYQFQRPYETWIPADGTFVDGQTGAPVTIYTYPASQVGTAFNRLEAINARSGRDDTFHSIEVAVTKRYSRKWTGNASFWTTKNHRWLGSSTIGAAAPQSPNDERFPTDDTWNWEGRANVTYNFPLGINASVNYRSQSGAPGQRTQAFSAASTVLRQGSVTLRMGPFGEFQAPAVQIVALRLGKTVQVKGSHRMEFTFQLFNALNGSGITSVSYVTGSQFGQVTGITSARVARIGAAYLF
jgi:hypothetical protein